MTISETTSAAATQRRRRAILGVKLAVVLWLAYGLLRGLAWQFVMSSRDPAGLFDFSNRLYIFPFVAGLPCLVSRRLTALSGVLLAACAVWAAAIVGRTHAFGRPEWAGEYLDLVALYPALSAAALLPLAWYEARVPRHKSLRAGRGWPR